MSLIQLIDASDPVKPDNAAIGPIQTRPGVVLEMPERFGKSMT